MCRSWSGLRALTSLGEAEFLHNEVPGVEVPTEIFQRMGDAEAGGTGAAVAEGVRIAVEVFERSGWWWPELTSALRRTISTERSRYWPASELPVRAGYGLGQVTGRAGLRGSIPVGWPGADPRQTPLRSSTLARRSCTRR